ncbi:MAG: hypothetical protein ABJN69_15010 [Hellea sp.]
MKFLRYTLFAAAFLGAACQNGNETPNDKADVKSADFTLRATSDIRTPSPIKAATFVPNSVASWLGHIILLDKKGTLHRATTDSAETEVVALGRYADVIGIAREKKSGVFLALTPQGQIKAFVQSDNEGNFSPLAVSQGEQTFERFCALAAPSGSTIWARTTSRSSQKLNIDIFEDTSVTLSKANVTEDETDPCEANNALNLSGGLAVKPDSSSNGLILVSDKKNMTMQVENGLSIGGVKDAGFVTVTSANMGSVYNEGVLLIAEKHEGRLVLISRGYAIKELETR